MQREASFFGSSIGKKVVMAASGLVLFGFVVGHMIGNLQIYLGAEALNAYAEVLLAVVLHIWAATSLTLSNWSARPVGYRQWQARESTYASRTMVWSGPILAAFIIYHLAHLTTGAAHPEFVAADVYRNVVIGFQNPFVSAFYILAMLALGLHMYHGVWSMLQTLGLSHERWNPWRRVFSAVVTGIVVVGNISFPVAVLTGAVHL